MGRSGVAGRRGAQRDVVSSGKRRNAPATPLRPTGGRVPLPARCVAARLRCAAPRLEPRLTNGQRNAVKGVTINDLWYKSLGHEKRAGTLARPGPV